MKPQATASRSDALQWNRWLRDCAAKPTLQRAPCWKQNNFVPAGESGLPRVMMSSRLLVPLIITIFLKEAKKGESSSRPLSACTLLQPAPASCSGTFGILQYTGTLFKGLARLSLSSTVRTEPTCEESEVPEWLGEEGKL